VKKPVNPIHSPNFDPNSKLSIEVKKAFKYNFKKIKRKNMKLIKMCVNIK